MRPTDIPNWITCELRGGCLLKIPGKDFLAGLRRGKTIKRTMGHQGRGGEKSRYRRVTIVVDSEEAQPSTTNTRENENMAVTMIADYLPPGSYKAKVVEVSEATSVFDSEKNSVSFRLLVEDEKLDCPTGFMIHSSAIRDEEGDTVIKPGTKLGKIVKILTEGKPIQDLSVLEGMDIDVDLEEYEGNDGDLKAKVVAINGTSIKVNKKF